MPGSLEHWVPSSFLFLAGTIKPICLPFSDEELTPATPLWVIGWGFTEQGGGKYRMTGQGEQLSEVIGRRAILQGKNILEVQEPGCPTAQKNYCGLR